MTETPIIDDTLFPNPDEAALLTPPRKAMPQILIPYALLRPRSFSRLSRAEAGLLLIRLGAEVRFCNPSGLPLVDDGVDPTHLKLRKLRDPVACCEGMLWSSPERHHAPLCIRWATCRYAKTVRSHFCRSGSTPTCSGPASLPSRCPSELLPQGHPLRSQKRLKLQRTSLRALSSWRNFHKSSWHNSGEIVTWYNDEKGPPWPTPPI